MNILIIKTGAMGDVLRTSFIAQALKDKYGRGAKIFWVTAEGTRSLFINNPYVDHVLKEEEREKLNEISFGIVINLEEDEGNCKFVSTLNARERIGFLWRDGNIVPSSMTKEWFDMSAVGEKPRNNILKKKNKKTHRQLIGEIIGVNWRKYEPFLRLTGKQREIVNAFLRRYNLSRKDLIIGINTGAADRWPKSLSIKKTAQLVDEIYKKYGAKILLFGGLNEIERNREILRKSRSPVIDTGCGNDLVEFPALISVCSLFITSDSLGLHISLALKRKTIALMGVTSPTEIHMYDIGEKVVAKSKDVCSYKRKSDCMEKIDLKEVLKAVENLKEMKTTLLITAYKEPKLGKAIKAALNQENARDYDILVSAPDEATLEIAREFARKDNRVEVYKDPGKGKSYALNILFKKIRSDILILTDGDVWMGRSSIAEIQDLFLDPEIGCVTGRPVPVENRQGKYGYWANFLFEAAHRIRKESFERNEFIEGSGYLFGFRKNKINSIPLDVAEDSVIPYYFWEKGYKIGYAERAEVYVKNVDNWRDWIKQKIRTSKAHETLNKYVNTDFTPRVKSFGNEARGVKWLWGYPENLLEYLWTFELVGARFFMWGRVFVDTKFRARHYGDAWERVESTK
jgi:ADP-heptose:LPS heptosyltransferase/glycosyltransferase involved in cell wall biosynthesis